MAEFNFGAEDWSTTCDPINPDPPVTRKRLPLICMRLVSSRRGPSRALPATRFRGGRVPASRDRGRQNSATRPWNPDRTLTSVAMQESLTRRGCLDPRLALQRSAQSVEIQALDSGVEVVIAKDGSTAGLLALRSSRALGS